MGYTEEGIDQRSEILLAGGNPAILVEDSLVFWLKENGKLLVPDDASAFVTILDPSGTQLVARTAADQDGSQLSYTRTFNMTGTAPNFTAAEDYVALWEWTINGTAFTDRQFFDCVRTKLPCPLDDSNLMVEYPNLLLHFKALKEDDLTKPIKLAWSTILDRIRAGGNRPSLILDRARLTNPAIQLALAFASGMLARESGDIWADRETKHFKRFEELFNGLGTLKYDKNEDGVVEEKEETRVNRREWFV